MMIKKRMNPRILLFSIVVLLIFGYNGVPQESAEAVTAEEKPVDEKKLTIGEEERFILPSPTDGKGRFTEGLVETYGYNALVGIRYPVFNKASIDARLFEQVHQVVDGFTTSNGGRQVKPGEDRAVLTGSYTTHEALERYTSVQLVFQVYNPQDGKHSTEVRSLIFDNANNKIVSTKDLFTDQALQVIASKTDAYLKDNETFRGLIEEKRYATGIAGNWENYKLLQLTADGIEITLMPGQAFPASQGVVVIPLSYEDVGTALKQERDREVATQPKKPVETSPQVDPNAKKIAFTFDDGPSAETTGKILDTMKEYGAKGTFFVLGHMAEKNPDVIKRAVEEGHQLGNHTYGHPDLTTLSDEKIQNTIAVTNDIVEKATGVTMKIVRPTYGAVDADVQRALSDYPLINWSLDTLDWKSRNTDSVVEKVLSAVKEGDIILFHDIYETTAEAIAILVPKLVEQGYTIVTVEQLMESDGEVLEGGRIYTHKTVAPVEADTATEGE